MRILAANELVGAALSATSTAVNYAVENLASGNLFEAWQPSATGINIITVDFAANTLVDAIGIAGHDLYSSGITSITVRLYNSSSTLLATDVFNITSDKVLLLELTSTTAASAQIEINVISTLPKIATIYIGESLFIDRSPPFGTDMPLLNNGSKTRSSNNDVGGLLGKLIDEPEGVKHTISLKRIDLTWCLTKWVPFVDIATNTPFFVTLSSLIPDALYATAQSKVQPKLASPTTADIRLPIEGVIS